MASQPTPRSTPAKIRVWWGLIKGLMVNKPLIRSFFFGGGARYVWGIDWPAIKTMARPHGSVFFWMQLRHRRIIHKRTGAGPRLSDTSAKGSHIRPLAFSPKKRATKMVKQWNQGLVLYQKNDIMPCIWCFKYIAIAVAPPPLKGTTLTIGSWYLRCKLVYLKDWRNLEFGWFFHALSIWF